MQLKKQQLELDMEQGTGSKSGKEIFLCGKLYEQRSLVSYSPWGHKESDTTEHTHTHFHCICFEKWSAWTINKNISELKGK